MKVCVNVHIVLFPLSFSFFSNTHTDSVLIAFYDFTISDGDRWAPLLPFPLIPFHSRHRSSIELLVFSGVD